MKSTKVQKENNSNMGIFDNMINIFKNNIKMKDERRKRNNEEYYPLRDIIISAFSIFYFQNPSWLSFQRKMKIKQHKSNLSSIFNISKVPSNTYIKNILDNTSSNIFSDVYQEILKYIENKGILKKYIFRNKYLLIALDGICYYSSTKVSCSCCQSKKDKKTNIISYFHNAITPTIIHPKMKQVIALSQEFISNKDGEEKQDCEVNASKRWLDKFNISAIFKQFKYKIIILGDDLYSRFPMIEKIISCGASFILVCKTTSHKSLYEQVETFKLANSHKTITKSIIHQGKKQVWIYSWINELLLNGNDKNNNIEVNWCELIITDNFGKQLHCFSFVSDMQITQENIADIISAGRARWKIENENNNTLKTKGYHLKHNYGHGKDNLSKNICSLNILAFLFHTIQEFEDKKYIKLREILGTREEFFQGIGFITTLVYFKNYEDALRWIIKRRSE